MPVVVTGGTGKAAPNYSLAAGTAAGGGTMRSDQLVNAMAVAALGLLALAVMTGGTSYTATQLLLNGSLVIVKAALSTV